MTRKCTQVVALLVALLHQEINAQYNASSAVVVPEHARLSLIRPPRISCNAASNAPCASVTSQWVSTQKAGRLTQAYDRPADAELLFAESLSNLTNKSYNMQISFYPFVFDRETSLCVAHGDDPSLVNLTLDSIFRKLNLTYISSADLHNRFVEAADNGGDWVQYLWRQDGVVVEKVAYVTAVAEQYYIGVGYSDVELPADLPCSHQYDSWCSINNVLSVVGKARSRLTKALSLAQFEAALHQITTDPDFEIEGGYYVFVAKLSGPLVAHALLEDYLGEPLELIYPKIGREREYGALIHNSLVAAAQGQNDGWSQYRWKNPGSDSEFLKISYSVKITFGGEEYFLGSGYSHVMGKVIEAPLGKKCPSCNLPCAFGTTLQLTSHVLSFALSSPMKPGDIFRSITEDIGVSDNYYTFMFDFNGTCVSHGGTPEFVGSDLDHITQIAQESVDISLEDADVLLQQFISAANRGGGYVFYHYGIPGVAGSDFLKVSYVFKLTLDGRDYFGGVGFSQEQASLQLELDTGTKLNGEPIPCTSDYGTNCSEVNSHAILGQALSDLIFASTEFKVGLYAPSASVEDVLLSITEGNDLYRANDFFVAVFSFNQARCLNQGALSDNSGCCVAHGGNSSFVGMTWQDILNAQETTSIRGEDLHNKLSGESDVGGGWYEYTLARQGEGGKRLRALSSRFRSQGEYYYVVTEYAVGVPPPTCDDCSSTMICIDEDQAFCIDRQDVVPFYRTTVFIVICVLVLLFPPVGTLFCWVGKRRAKQLAETQIREIDQQMQMLHDEMEKEKMTAAQARKLVSSLFPENVQSQILDQIAEEECRSSTDKLRSFLSGAPSKKLQVNDKPIAELFPDATVIFMDIVGFTAWSSTREPTQVFRLLEGVYQQFDRLAKERRVFKVETIGDCWLGVAGLPERMENHAEVIALFADDCSLAFRKTVTALEVYLGPDTDLRLRTGFNSGPVTAGVLKGDKARFQLFGDTVNTASRLETTGLPGMIQISEETANLLKKAGKEDWYRPREETIVAKGKGKIKTFWLDISPISGSPSRLGDQKQQEEEKLARMILWVTEALTNILKQIHGQRQNRKTTEKRKPSLLSSAFRPQGETVLDEVCEVIHMPSFCGQEAIDPEEIDLDPKVTEQVETFVRRIAALYQNNPFHNFEHAAHVTMSVLKLMSRIVAPDLNADHTSGSRTFASKKHDHTYGITSDPLTHFAVAFSALIHDTGHSGVPNLQVTKERPSLSAKYGERSVAEQNSVDLSWDLLMKTEFADLRHSIYGSGVGNRTRFRQLVVNCVMATDIMDADLKNLRNRRWDRAFNNNTHDNGKDASDRKATVVIDHLMQASDVVHTMQHWHVYRKWNQRLFEEMFAAYTQGRAKKDPVEFWYRGVRNHTFPARILTGDVVHLLQELGFFDFYVIPLAKKLDDCGVFGVSSSEYLGYAEKNREEWELRGESIVAKMSQECHQQLNGSLSGELPFP